MDIKAFDCGFAGLVHQIHVAHEQVKCGLYVVKRYTHLLKVMSEAWKIAAQTTLKATKQVTGRKEKVEHDKMDQHVVAFWEVNNFIEQTSAAQLKFANDMQTLIIQPLTSFYKDGEKKRKKILQQEEKLNANMAVLKQNVKKEREGCITLWGALKGVYEEMEKEGGKDVESTALDPMKIKRESSQGKLIAHQKQKSVEKIEKKLAKSHKTYLQQNHRTYKYFMKFECQIREMNQKEQKQWEEELPKILKMLERMEVERLQNFESLTGRLVEMHTRLEKKLSQLSVSLTLSLKKLDTSATVKAFVTSTIKTYGAAPPLQMMKYDLPCRPEVVSENGDALRKALASDVSTPTSVSLLSPPSSPSPHSPIGFFGLGSSFSSSTSEEKDGDLSDDEAPPSPPPTVAAMTETEAKSIIIVKSHWDLMNGEATDLVFQKGQYIRIVSKNENDAKDKASLLRSGVQSDWWFGFVLAGHSSHFWRENVIGLVPLNYIEVIHLNSDVGLRPFLEYPSALKAFTAFLESEYAAENIHFWLAVQEFHSLALSLKNEELPALPRKSVAVSSPSRRSGVTVGSPPSSPSDEKFKAPPPVPSKFLRKGQLPTPKSNPVLVKRAEEIITQFISESAPDQVNIMGSTRDAVIEQLEPEGDEREKRASVDMFDQAQHEVYTMMTRDSWSRFRHTDSFKAICDSFGSYVKE